MTHIIDRRLNPKDKTVKNRKRFIDLHKKQLRDQVKKILDSGDVDISGSTKRVKINPTTEPTFHNNRKTGTKEYVLPGNKKYNTGDTIPRPDEEGGGGGGPGEASDSGEGEDAFEFLLTDEEFRDFVFDELELPDFVKKQMKNVTQHEVINAGFKSEGNPNQLHIVRSMRNSIARKIGLKRPKEEDIEGLEAKIAKENRPVIRKKLEADLVEMKRRRKAIPWIDPFDIRYKNQIKFPKPHTQAVMFCVMDVSYSMTEEEKDIAKRFFMLLNLFLKRKYNNVDIVFIAHHSTARECTEEEFFRSKETGGTVVSTATELVENIIKERYKPDDWNIYVAQASDGDNVGSDTEKTKSSVLRILKDCQYYAYIEVMNASRKHYSYLNQETILWKTLKDVAMMGYKKLALQQVTDKKNVWKVFSNLFARTKADNKHIYGE